MNEDDNQIEEEPQEEVVDPLLNPNWEVYKLKSPIHTTEKFKDEFMDTVQDEYLEK